MGVPFEALLPYGIMLGVRTNLPAPHQTKALTPRTDVRNLRSGPLKDQTHAERRQESKTLDRSMGQTECAYFYGTA